jgi:hypothetical protein
MATSSSYYLNAPSLGSATAVFTNAALSVCAADGFYSDGVIVREQVGCVLLPQQTCPACATPCGTTINASGGQGIYLLDLETGTTVSDIGAVIIRFNPQGVPDGIRATLGANVYNKLTSPVDGLHQSSNAGAFTFVGATSADCGISGTTYPTLAEFEYNGTAFVATGDTQSVTVAAGDVSLGASAPGNTMMVIPKLTPSPSIINFEVVGPCSGTAWSMSVACPVLLTGFSSSVMAATSNAACLLAETTTYYNASLANTPGTVGLYDFVFSDAYGNTPLAAGFYYAAGSITGSNDWFQVNSSGIVIALGVCISVSYNCVEGVCTDPGDGTGEYATLVACEAECSAPGFATLDWNYTRSAISGNMDLYVNGSIIESRSSTSSGTWNVGVGDTINVEVVCNQCTASPNTYANAYCTGIITDADCQNNGVASIFTAVYTVVSGDIGNTLSLDAFSTCDSACI